MDLKKYFAIIGALLIVFVLSFGSANLIGLRPAPQEPVIVAIPVLEIPTEPITVPPPATPVPSTSKTPIDYIQLSSHRTPKEAARAIDIHSTQLKGIVSASLMEVYKVSLISGTWYRVVIPQPSRKDAEKTCELVKAKGQECLVFTF